MGCVGAGGRRWPLRARQEKAAPLRCGQAGAGQRKRPPPPLHKRPPLPLHGPASGPREMARHYARTDLPADLLGFIPADWLLLGTLAACEAASGGGSGYGAGACSGALEWLPLLRLLHLARLYRVKKLFSYLVGGGCLMWGVRDAGGEERS